MSNKPVIQCSRLGKVYDSGPQSLEILKEVDLSLVSGERLAVVGASGSGKSTLLHCLGGLDDISSGQLYFDGVDYFAQSHRQRAELRNKHLGFVYQFHHLLPEFTALENVAMPLLIGGIKKQRARQLASDMLSEVGLKKRILHKPSELSGGERQRAAIARAMVTEPACLLADEPTGNLDRKTAEQIYQLMLKLNEKTSMSLVLVTHDVHLANNMETVKTLIDGQLVDGVID